jgi:HD-like signal output (HDOD) protein
MGEPTWQRILGDFLLQKKFLDTVQLETVKTFYNGLDRRIGQLSLLKGYLTLEDVMSILNQQTQGTDKFGETALKLGKLKEEQLKELLALQKNPSDLFLNSLVFTELVDASALTKIHEDLRRYFEERNRDAAPAAAPPPPVEKLSKEEVRGVIRRIKTLGALPGVVQRILALTETADAHLGDLEKAITADPAMTVQLLRIVNSAAYGAVRKISTVREALARIGMKGVRNVALATVILDRFKGSDKTAMRSIWRHSVLTCQWAQVLATARGGRILAEDAFIAGLVHDVGKTALRQFFPECVGPLETRVKEGVPPSEAEREYFGQTHDDLGAYLCQLWEFPGPVTQAVAFHHLPPATLRAMPELSPLALHVHAGCRLADLPFQKENEEANRKALEGLEPEFRGLHRIDAALAAHVNEVFTRADEFNRWL